MFDYLKYLPIEMEWCQRDDYCIPRGPNFRWAPWVTIPIAGSRLRLKAPRHSPLRSVEQWRLLPGQDLLDDPRLNHMATGVMANDYWGNAPALSRRFAFWGPWLSGCKAELTMSVGVWGRHEGHEFADLSFFHPKAFEMVLVQYLNDYYGHKNWETYLSHVPRWHGPADWQRHNHLPVFAASCKIYSQGPDPDITNNLSFPEHLFLFPITDQHFVQIKLVQHLYSRDKNGDIAFDTAPIQALQDAIVNSISLELSPEAQASYDRIKKEVRNMQLPKEFAPLKWPIDPSAPQPPASDSANTTTDQHCLWKL